MGLIDLVRLNSRGSPPSGGHPVIVTFRNITKLIRGMVATVHAKLQLV
jgi:hypothetical protein